MALRRAAGSGADRPRRHGGGARGCGPAAAAAAACGAQGAADRDPGIGGPALADRSGQRGPAICPRPAARRSRRSRPTCHGRRARRMPRRGAARTSGSRHGCARLARPHRLGFVRIDAAALGRAGSGVAGRPCSAGCSPPSAGGAYPRGRGQARPGRGWQRSTRPSPLGGCIIVRRARRSADRAASPAASGIG